MRRITNGIVPVLAIYFLDILSYAMLSPIVTLLFLEGPYSVFPNSGQSEHFLFGLYLSIFSFFQIISVPLWGKLSLKISKTSVLKFALIGNMISYLIGGLGVILTQPVYLFIGVFIAGLSGTILPTLNAILAERSPKSRLTNNFSLMGATISIAFILGPQITAQLLNFYPPKVICSFVYFFCAIVACINFVYVTLFIKERVDFHKEKNLLKHLNLADFCRDLRAMEVCVKKILIFQFFISLGWYFFVKFFQIYLLENLSLDEQESCYGISFLGVSCALWQGARYFQDWSFNRRKDTFVALVGLMGLSMLSFLYIKSYLAIMFWTCLLSFSYSMIIPASMSLLLNSGNFANEIKTSMFQTMQSLAKVISPLLSGLCLSFTHGATAILGAFATLMAAFIVFQNPDFFCIKGPSSNLKAQS